jgi:hypothetical protein
MTNLLHTITIFAATAPKPHSPPRFFLEPLPIQNEWWITLIPLALLVSMAYKAVRVRTFDGYWRQVLMMTIQIIVAMIALAAALYLFVELIVPALDSP